MGSSAGAAAGAAAAEWVSAKRAADATRGASRPLWGWRPPRERDTLGLEPWHAPAARGLRLVAAQPAAARWSPPRARSPRPHPGGQSHQHAHVTSAPVHTLAHAVHHALAHGFADASRPGASLPAVRSASVFAGAAERGARARTLQASQREWPDVRLLDAGAGARECTRTQPAAARERRECRGQQRRRRRGLRPIQPATPQSTVAACVK